MVDREQRPQALIEQIDAGKEMQDALVDAQRRADQRLVRLHLDQPPAAQRTRGRQRTPMRLVERAERRGEASATLAIGLCTGRGKLRVHLHARAQQQGVALEWRQLEDIRDHVDGSRRRHLRRGAVAFFGIVCRRFTRDPPAQPQQLSDQISLIFLDPGCWLANIGHGFTSSCGPMKTGGETS